MAVCKDGHDIYGRLLSRHYSRHLAPSPKIWVIHRTKHSILPVYLIRMVTNKKPIPPEDIINEDSGPPIKEIGEPKKKPEGGVDIDDAQIQEPRDDVFRKPEEPPKGLRK